MCKCAENGQKTQQICRGLQRCGKNMAAAAEDAIIFSRLDPTEDEIARYLADVQNDISPPVAMAAIMSNRPVTSRRRSLC